MEELATVPKWARRFHRVLRDLPEDLADYKGFIGYYTENDIVPADPFQTIDQVGIGRLMKIGVGDGRQTRPDLKIGICGEHGGDYL